jgi:hypothetical protein
LPDVAALKELDLEEVRLTALIGRLEDEIVRARTELQEIQVARRVLQRLNEQVAQPETATVSSANISSEPAVESDGEPGFTLDDERTPPGRPTIKEAALKALESAYPKGFQKSGIETWIRANLGFTVNYASLSVMLARLRDDDHAIQNQGNAWFYVPKDKRQAA